MVKTLEKIIHASLPALSVSEQEIVRKLMREERLNPGEGLELFNIQNLNLLGALANARREKLHGNRAYFIHNQHLNNTNICVLHCQFCSFRRSPGEEGSYSYSKEEIYRRIRNTIGTGIREVHIVNGLHAKLGLEFYEEVLRGIKEIRPDLHIKAFTSIEIDFFARLAKVSRTEVFERLRAAGLDSMPGGGAEIFAERIRKQICGEKLAADAWLDVHRHAHSLGIHSTCTMLYGHIESLEDRIDHMNRLRALQDETQGFTCFIPLRFHVEGNPLGKNLKMSEMMDDLRNYAVARLFLDNIPHLKAYWIMAGCDTARLALNYGCDDLDGTIQEEIITHMAGCESPLGLARKNLLDMIHQAGRDAMERDSLYNIVDDDPKADTIMPPPKHITSALPTFVPSPMELNKS